MYYLSKVYEIKGIIFSFINNYSHVEPSTVFVKLVSSTNELLLYNKSLFLYQVSVIRKLSDDGNM